MTGLSISERADDWANQFQAGLDSLPAYSPQRSRATLSVQSGITLARMLAEIVRDLAEEKLILLRVIDSQAREIEQLQQGES